MPETAPRELMVLVEQVVRPLPLPYPRQKRVRTEFLGHLREIYAEELARDQDDAAALRRTQTRFGDPPALSAELSQSIRWHERIMSWCERKTHESPAGYSLRVSMTLFAIFALEGAGLATFCPPVQAGTPFHLWFTTTAWLLGFSLALTSFLFVFLYCSWRLGEEWRRPSQRWSRLALFASPIFAFGPICLAAAVFFSGTPAYHHLWQAALQMLMIVIVGAMMGSLGTYLGVRHDQQMSYRRKWSDLDLNAA